VLSLKSGYEHPQSVGSGLLTILGKIIAIAIAIIGQKTIAIAIPILVFKSIAMPIPILLAIPDRQRLSSMYTTPEHWSLSSIYWNIKYKDYIVVKLVNIIYIMLSAIQARSQGGFIAPSCPNLPPPQLVLLELGQPTSQRL
jgi:hypothetical protein